MKWEFFVPLVSFLGLVAGMILAKVSPEEMGPGKRFFRVMRLSIILLLGVMLLYYSEMNLILLAIGIAIGFFLRLGYLYLGAAIVGALLASREALLMISSLVFMYGLPYGTLLESSKRMGTKRMLLFALVFAIPFLLLLLPIGSSHILSLTAGLLVGQVKEDI